MKSALLVTLLVLNTTATWAQTPKDMPIDAKQREAILDGAAQRYDSLYVFADRGRAIRDQLKSKAVRARYAHCATASCLADSLTKDLQSWSNDKHLRLVYSVQPRPMDAQADPTAAKARELEQMRQRNFGFHNVERLHGNIGYIEIGRFDPAADAAGTAAAVMQFVANTDALVIDVRNNGGGYADMVAYLMSYFVPEQTHLGTMKRRIAGDEVQFWTSHISGSRYLNKPIYVLTGKRTFSAAENLTYNLQQFANAKAVGEPTRGGAHPGGFEQLNDHFAVFVPTGRTINARTGGNWEGVGIKVDYPVAASDAVKTAQKLALQELLHTQPQSTRVGMWRQAIEELFPETKSAAKSN
jgi:retinol-binding protein 3